MTAIKDWHIVFLSHLVDSGEETHKVLLGINVLFSMCAQKNILSFLQAQTLVNIAGLNLCEVVMQHLCHRAAGDVSALLGQTGICQIPAGVLTVRHIHITDDIHNPAIGLLWQALILTTVAGFHMEDGDMQALGTNHAEAAVGVTQHQYCIGLHFHHQLVTLGNDVAHSLTQVITYSLHIHIRICQLQVFEEHPIQVVVIVLTGVCQQAVKVLTALINHCSKADNLRPCANNNQKLQLSIVLKLCHISFYLFHFTGSKKVSGLFGLKISLQYITVTKSSVSERLMMLWV